MEAAGISQGIFDQGTLFVSGILCGVVVWFLYDLLRLWRRLIAHKELWIAIEDVLFFLICAIVGFQLLYPLSLGQTRVFLILAVAIGSLAYHKLISPHLIRGGTWLIHRLKKAFRPLFRKREKKQQQYDKIPIEK